MKSFQELPTIKAPRPRARSYDAFDPFTPTDFIHATLESPIYRLVQRAADGEIESVFINDEAEARRILLNEEDIWRKGPQTYEPFLSLVPRHLIGLEGEYHLKLRGKAQAALSEALTEGRIPAEEMGKRVIEHIRRCINEKQASWIGSRGMLDGQVVLVTEQIDRIFRAAALDIVSTTVFGRRWGVIDDYSETNVRAWTLAKVMEELHWRVTDFNYREWRKDSRAGPAGPLLDILDAYVLDEIAQSITRTKAAEYKSPQCMLDSWTSDPELSIEEIRNLAMTFLTMGSENVSTALSWCAVLLSEHLKEQDDARQSKDSLLHAFNEAVRLYPSVAVLTRTASVETSLCGYQIPRFTEIIINMFSIHRNKTTWGEASSDFMPSRCPVVSGEGPPDAFPFGGGKRTCIGRPLTFYELNNVLGQVLQHFRLIAVRHSGGEEYVVDGHAKTTPNNFVSLRPGKHMIAFVPIGASSAKL